LEKEKKLRRSELSVWGKKKKKTIFLVSLVPAAAITQLTNRKKRTGCTEILLGSLFGGRTIEKKSETQFDFLECLARKHNVSRMGLERTSNASLWPLLGGGGGADKGKTCKDRFLFSSQKQGRSSRSSRRFAAGKGAKRGGAKKCHSEGKKNGLSDQNNHDAAEGEKGSGERVI